MITIITLKAKHKDSTQFVDASIGEFINPLGLHMTAIHGEVDSLPSYQPEATQSVFTTLFSDEWCSVPFVRVNHRNGGDFLPSDSFLLEEMRKFKSTIKKHTSIAPSGIIEFYMRSHGDIQALVSGRRIYIQHRRSQVEIDCDKNPVIYSGQQVGIVPSIKAGSVENVDIWTTHPESYSGKFKAHQMDRPEGWIHPTESPWRLALKDARLYNNAY